MKTCGAQKVRSREIEKNRDRDVLEKGKKMYSEKKTVHWEARTTTILGQNWNVISVFGMEGIHRISIWKSMALQDEFNALGVHEFVVVYHLGP